MNEISENKRPPERTVRGERSAKTPPVLPGSLLSPKNAAQSVVSSVTEHLDNIFRLAFGADREELVMKKDGSGELTEDERIAVEKKALERLLNDKDFSIDEMDPKKCAELEAVLEEWLSRNREKIAAMIEASEPDSEARQEKLEMVRSLDGKSLLKKIREKQQDNIAVYKHDIMQAEQEKLIREGALKLNETEASRKGQEIIDRMRKDAYRTLAEGSSTPSQVADAMAVIMVCHSFSEKSSDEIRALMKDKKKGDGPEAIVLAVNAEKNRSVRSRAQIGDDPRYFADNVSRLKEQPAFAFFSEAQLEDSLSLFREKRNELAGFALERFGEDGCADRLAQLRSEAFLIDEFDLKNSRMKEAIELEAPVREKARIRVL